MKAELFDLWIEKLTDGSYEQGREALKVISDSGETQYCCLGVLCDISGEGEWVGFSFKPRYRYEESANSEFVPDELARELGIARYGVPLARVGYYETDPAAMNDAGYSFREIAEFLKENRDDYVDEEAGS